MSVDRFTDKRIQPEALNNRSIEFMNGNIAGIPETPVVSVPVLKVVGEHATYSRR